MSADVDAHLITTASLPAMQIWGFIGRVELPTK